MMISYLKFTINRKIEGEPPEVEREQMALRVVEARVRRPEAVLHLLDRRGDLRRVETHATGTANGLLSTISEEKTII